MRAFAKRALFPRSLLRSLVPQDSFGELRQHRQMVQGKIDNECFICGIDRFTFDTKGSGFDKHVTAEHSKWNYLFMLVSLREKRPDEYNGWEQHVAQHLSPHCTPPSAAFLPRNTALALREHQEREEREVRRQSAQAERTARLVEEMVGIVEGVRQKQEDMERKLAKLVSG